MRVGYQQSWLMAETWEERPATVNWEWLVEIIQMAFGDSRLLAEFSWNMVVLITKVFFLFMSWDCGCPLEGVIRSNKLAYKGGGAVPGFWAGRVMGTASLKSNMLQHLTSMREEVLYNYF